MSAATHTQYSERPPPVVEIEHVAGPHVFHPAGSRKNAPTRGFAPAGRHLTNRTTVASESKTIDGARVIEVYEGPDVAAERHNWNQTTASLRGEIAQLRSELQNRSTVRSRLHQPGGTRMGKPHVRRPITAADTIPASRVIEVVDLRRKGADGVRRLTPDGALRAPIYTSSSRKTFAATFEPTITVEREPLKQPARVVRAILPPSVPQSNNVFCSRTAPIGATREAPPVRRAPPQAERVAASYACEPAYETTCEPAYGAAACQPPVACETGCDTAGPCFEYTDVSFGHPAATAMGAIAHPPFPGRLHPAARPPQAPRARAAYGPMGAPSRAPDSFVPAASVGGAGWGVASHASGAAGARSVPQSYTAGTAEFAGPAARFPNFPGSAHAAASVPYHGGSVMRDVSSADCWARPPVCADASLATSDTAYVRHNVVDSGRVCDAYDSPYTSGSRVRAEE